MRSGLGDATVDALFEVYDARIPAEADLVCYWFAKAWEALQAGRAKRVGLVATNSIRGGANRKVLEPIAEAGAIFRGVERRAVDDRRRGGAGVAGVLRTYT